MWIAVAVHPPLFAWAIEIKKLKRELCAKRYEIALELIMGDTTHRSALKPPDGILELRKDIPELGEAAGPLGRACFLLSEVAGKLGWIDDAVHGVFDGQEHDRAMKLLHRNIEDAEALLWQSERLVKRQFLREPPFRVYARIVQRKINSKR